MVLSLLFQLIPGGGHEWFLLEPDHLGADTGGHTMTRVQIQFPEPVRRLIGRRDCLLVGVPLSV